VKKGRLVGSLLLEIFDRLLDTALESMRSYPAAKAGSIAIRFTHAETPGRPVFGQWAAQISVFFQTLSNVDSIAEFAGSFWCHFVSSLSNIKADYVPVFALPLFCVRMIPAIRGCNRKKGVKVRCLIRIFRQKSAGIAIWRAVVQDKR